MIKINLIHLKKIIHNYGHGGNGIALCRGTAVHAVRLLTESNENIQSKL